MTNTTLTFRTNSDGQAVVDCWENTVPGVEGSSETYHYVADRPENVALETATHQTPAGVRIGTGIVITPEGTGRGVAWRI